MKSSNWAAKQGRGAYMLAVSPGLFLAAAAGLFASPALLCGAPAMANRMPFHLPRVLAHGPVEIIARVRTVKIYRLPHRGWPVRFKNGLALQYRVEVMFSDSPKIKAGNAVNIDGAQTAGVAGAGVSNFGTNFPLNWHDPIMRPGAIFIAGTYAEKNNGGFRFASATVLPIGVPVPSPLASGEIRPIEDGLRAWSEARKSGFTFYPYANVLPKKQTALLMKSRNFYLWALGVSSYCGGANKQEIASMINGVFYRPDVVGIPRPASRIHGSASWHCPKTSIRKVAWLLYAIAMYSRPTCRPTAQTVASLMMAAAADRRQTGSRPGFVYPAARPWAAENQSPFRLIRDASNDGYGSVRRNASVTKFLNAHDNRPELNASAPVMNRQK